MRHTLFASAATAAVLLLSACGGGGAQGAADPAKADPNLPIVYSTTYGVSSWDPHKTKVTSDVTMINQIYEPLVRHDAEGKPVPGLAESWKLSEDSKMLTLKLRQGVKFTDGEPFNAAAAKTNLDRAKEKDSITANMLAPVSKIETPDETTLNLSLTRPGGAMPLVLSDLPGMMVSPKALSNPEALKTQPVGAGPWKLTSQRAGAHYEMEANADYWNKGLPKTKKMVWEIIIDPQTRLNALASGQLNAAVTATNIIEPARQQGLQVQTKRSLNNYILNFNQKRSEFGKLGVRQAIATAIDREEIVKAALEGKGVAGSQLFPPGYFANDPSLQEMYKPDLDKAKQLLTEAGLPNGFSFDAVVLNQPVYVTQAEIIKARLAKIGVTMNLKPVPASEVSPIFNRGESDAIVTAMVGRSDPTQTLEQYFTKEASSNPSHTEPEGLRQTLDEANTTDKQEQRAPLIGKASKIVMENALIVPLAQYDLGAMYSDKVAGYQPHLVGDEWTNVGIVP